jgi:ribosome-associated translation inhibitor RaiA/cold shock CspA family protein
MQIPLQFTFKDMDPSPAIEARIREKAAQLERFFDHVSRCHVVVSSPHRHHRKGRLYQVTVHLTLPPRRELTIGREGRQDHAHEDINVAIRDTSDAAVRQVEDHARRIRADVKAQEAPMHGRVVRLFPAHGFIETSDGQEVYFNRNSVLEEGFDALDVGREVRLVVAEAESSEGWQATTVHPIGKHHIVP